MRARAVVAVVSFVALPLAVACSGTDPYEPGTAIGTFAVNGTLKTSSCGPGAPNPWQFSVKLSTDPGILYWIQGSLPISGTLSSANAVTMTSTTQSAYGDDAGDSCTIQRVDSLAATLTPDPTIAHEYASFSGTLSYTFSQAGAGDCSLALTSNGGGYAALPCTVSYTLAATRSALPNQYGK